MKILIDMNLSPAWRGILEREGWESVHWSEVGDPRATDATILLWAKTHGYLVFTHDLDFGTILAATRAAGPSVIQVRAQDILPDRLGPLVVDAIKRHEEHLTRGALVVVDEARSRIRILPIDTSSG